MYLSFMEWKFRFTSAERIRENSDTFLYAKGLDIIQWTSKNFAVPGYTMGKLDHFQHILNGLNGETYFKWGGFQEYIVKLNFLVKYEP